MKHQPKRTMQLLSLSRNFTILLSCFLFLLAMIAGTFATEVKTDIVFSEVAGEKLVLDAFVPKGDGPFPACILVHGGGWMKGDKQNNFKTLLGPLGEAGFAWFSINYRLAPLHRYPACVEDVETAIRWVKAHAAEYNVDPNRIGLIGESAGGHLVATVGVQANDETRVAAVVPFYAPLDLELHAKQNLRTPAWAQALFGIAEMNDAARKTIRDASPMNHIVGGLPPFLLIHGILDDKVRPEQSLRFQEKMKAAGNVCDLILVDDVSHAMHTWEKVDRSYKEKLFAWLHKKLIAPAPE